MRRSERDALRARFRERCGYCGTTEVDFGAELTVDHFQPRAKQGEDTPDNWVYACSRCNEYKGDYWQPNSVARVLHPLRDDLTLHLRESTEGRLIALTETGRFHIEHLQLNRPQLIRQRLRNREIQAMRERAEQLEQENATLRREADITTDQTRWLTQEVLG